ncbi:peptidase [Xylariaceae sp. FL0016]|nr:peptidase [Xylariaceae sp. FL0016]
MRFQLPLALLSALGSTAFAATTTSASATNATVDDKVVRGAYIVEFDGDDDSSAFYQGLQAEGIEVEHRMDLKYRLFRGASFNLRNAAEPEIVASQINANPRVKSLWPVRKINFPKPDNSLAGSSSNATEILHRMKRQEYERKPWTPHIMTQVDKLLEEGYTGKGIRIGLVDTGVDYNHPALGGCFGEGCLIAYGYDFNGDNDTSPVPIPDADPYDGCVGHGTHVAGIIAAQLNEHGFTGAAPGVTLGMYKCTGCGGATTNEMLIAGFNAAFEDGSDIISCSAGDDSGWSSDPWALAASRIAEAGVPVIVAPGNDGHLGLWYTSTPASGVKVTAAGSVENTVLPILLKKGEFSVDNSTKSDFGFRLGTPSFKQNLTLPLWAVSNDTEAQGDACEPLPEDTPDLSDKAVLLRMPNITGCTPDLQATNLAAKGGQWLLWYSNVNETMSDLYIYNETTQGVGMITLGQGIDFVSELNDGSKIMVDIPDYESAGLYIQNWDNKPGGGYTSRSTTWGPTWEIDVKPQFTSPGGNILSTYPLPLGGYAVQSGTSMATPLIAAIFALLGEVRGTLDPTTLRNLLAATAKPKVWFDGETAYPDTLAPVAQQGAGLVQAWDAAFATTILSESSLSFNDSDHFVGDRTFNIQNTADEAVTYVLGHTAALTMYTLSGEGSVLGSTVFPNPTADDAATIAFNSNEITVAAGATAEVALTLTPPTALNATLLPVYSGYITLNSSKSEALSLPYLGVQGSLYDTPTIQEGYDGGVYLSSSSGHFNIPVAANTTFTINAPGNASTGSVIYPSLVFSLTLATPQLRADLVPVGETSLNTTEWMGYQSAGVLNGFPVTLVPRQGGTQYFKGQLDDGTVVPEGTYKFLVSAVKVFGDAEKADDWDIVETLPFVLKYQS